MLKIAAVVVLYNPELSVIQNINSYVNQVEKLYVVDNSAVLDDSLLEKIKSLDIVEYICNTTNLGIATALNIAAKKAVSEGFDYFLTMDQDSKASEELVEMLMSILQSSENIGIVAAEPLNINFRNEFDNENEIEKEVLFTITSGNLVSLAAYKSVGGFMEELFIDHVDHEFCLRLHRNDYKVIRTNRTHIFHKIGNPTQKKIFYWIFYPLHHSPLRIYYRTRNRFYVSRIYRESFPEYAKIDLKNFIREVFEIIAFEKNVLRKIKMIVIGYIHYKKNQFGKYPDEVN